MSDYSPREVDRTKVLEWRTIYKRAWVSDEFMHDIQLGDTQAFEQWLIEQNMPRVKIFDVVNATIRRQPPTREDHLAHRVAYIMTFRILVDPSDLPDDIHWGDNV